MHFKSVLGLALALTMGTSFQAFASSGDSASESAALAAVTVSAANAIAAVEARGTGQVVEFALLHEGGVSVYQITTLTQDGTETNYAVDAKTGAVVATVDVADNEGDGDGEYADDKGSHQELGDGDGETNDDGAGDGDGETQDD